MCMCTPEPKLRDSDNDVLSQAWSMCKKQSRSVEIFYKNMDGDEILTKMHFPVNPDVSSVIVLLTVAIRVSFLSFSTRFEKK